MAQTNNNRPTAEEILKDIIDTFKLIKNPLDSDASYILKSGRIVDTKGPYEVHQHENIAKYVSEKYKYNDLDENNGSKFMGKIANAVRITPWLNGIFIPDHNLTPAQYDILKKFIEESIITTNKPLLISNRSGTEFVEFSEITDAEDVLTTIREYYSYGKLMESKAKNINIKTTKYVDADPINLKDIEYYIEPKTKAIDAIINYHNKKTRVRSGVIIIKDNKILLSHENNELELSIPGGGLNKNETPIEAGIRECQEEALINLKNVQETGYNYCLEKDAPVQWVKDNIPEDKQWYNYYTILLLGEYKSDYTGFINDIDKDSSIFNNIEWIDINKAILLPTFKSQWKKALVKFGYINVSQLKEDYKTIYDTILIHVDNIRDGGGFDQELAVINHSIADTINNYRKKLGYGYRINYDGPGKTHENTNTSKQTKNQNYQQLSIFDNFDEAKHIAKQQELNESDKDIQIYCEAVSKLNDHNKNWNKDNTPTIWHYKNNNILKEDTRNTLISKSKNQGQYKDQKYGKNRFERQKYSSIMDSGNAYNQIDMNDFFKHDILTVDIPVTGETDNYTVSIKMEGIVTEIQKNIKNNKNKFEYKTILQALTKIFNTTNIFVNCTCDDFKYNFAHFSVINNYGILDSAHDPGPGKGIKNLKNDKGIGCKHVLLALSNTDWIMKVSSVIYNYITYAEDNLQKAFLEVIFPKLYDIQAAEMIEQNLINDEKYLKNPKGLINAINNYNK